jgi:hypothetical protein
MNRHPLQRAFSALAWFVLATLAAIVFGLIVYVVRMGG